MNFSSYKLGTKLGAAFFAVALLTAALGAFAILQLGKINASTDDLATNWLPSVKVLWQISSTVNQFRRAEADHIMSTTDKDMDAVETRFDTLKKKQGELQTVYGP